MSDSEGSYKSYSSDGSIDVDSPPPSPVVKPPKAKKSTKSKPEKGKEPKVEPKVEPKAKAPKKEPKAKAPKKETKKPPTPPPSSPSGSEGGDSFVSGSSLSQASPPPSPTPAKTETKKKPEPPREPTPPPSPTPPPKEEAKPAPKKRGRPRRVEGGETKPKKEAKKRSKPNKEEMIDAKAVCESFAELPSDVRIRIDIDQPSILSRVINAVSPLLASPQFSMSKTHLCLDSTDDSGFAVVTMRLKCSITLQDELKDEEDLFFQVDTKKIAMVLQNIHNFQHCRIEMRNEEDIDIIASDHSTSGNMSVATIQNLRESEYTPIGFPETSYKWHISDMDVADFQSIVRTAKSLKCKFIRFQIFEIKKDEEFILCISTGVDHDTKVAMFQHIELREDEETNEQVFAASSDTTLSNADMRSYVSENEPAYDKKFSSTYISWFLKATENKCIMTFHFTPDAEDEDGDLKPQPMILKHSLGDSSLTSYLKYAIGPLKA